MIRLGEIFLNPGKEWLI